MKWEKTFTEDKNNIYMKIKGTTSEGWEVITPVFLDYKIKFVLYDRRGLPVVNIWAEVPENLKKHLNTDLALFQIENSPALVEEFTKDLERWLEKEIQPRVLEEVGKYNIDDWLENVYKL